MPRTASAGLLMLAALLIGCARDDEQLAAARARLLLAAEPAGAQGVLDVRESLAAGQPVVVLGQIGGVSQPWTEGHAAFVIADPTVLMEIEGHDHEGGDHEGCPFCAKKLAGIDKESLAFVQFLGPDGKTLPHDARRLFELVPRQTVVVRGTATVDESGYLVVSADGLYVRR